MRIVSVDNPEHVANVLKIAFPYLGDSGGRNMSRIFDGDEGVRLDIFHFIHLVKDTCVDNHSSWKAAEEDLKTALWITCGEPSTYKGVSTVRKLVPPPHVLVPRLVDWCNKWLNHGMDASGVPLCTTDTVKLMERSLSQAARWRLSGG